MQLSINENGLYLVFELKENHPALLVYMGAKPWNGEVCGAGEYSAILEIQAAGENRLEHYGLGPCGTFPGNRMNYVNFTDERNEPGRILTIVTKDSVTGLESKMVYQFYDGIPVVRCRQILENKGEEDIILENVSSFVCAGLANGREEDLTVMIPHNSWQGEIQWREASVDQLGYRSMADLGMSSKRIRICSVGSWSAGEYLPMGCLRNVSEGTTVFWQIEHNGAWNWELQERGRKPALIINGPDEVNHHWWKTIKPGERFETVPAAVGCVEGGVDETFSALTGYRRAIRRKNQDNVRLPIIFNDYMNCLWGDPTTEKEMPIIDAAADVGCEYFCIDCGWYTDKYWWDYVGEWNPSRKRFPGGLKEVTDYIRQKGMIPGIWLEIEVMGARCEIAGKADDSWFFQRHGRRSLDRGRYHLDFRNAEVRAYTRGVVDRLIQEYGIGYFKIDYNINAGIGTEYHADSPGEGLLEHNRAYLAWLDDILAAYPDLVVENCSAGGMRMDYAMLSRYSIQSTSDQGNYLKYASIATNAPSALTPEQAAVWSYPLSDSTREQTIFNCVNSCLLRIHQSGHMGELAEDKKEILKEEMNFYKKIRCHIPTSLPFWPLGMARDGDDWMALGLDFGKNQMLAVWHIKGRANCDISLPKYKGRQIHTEVVFPRGDKKCVVNWAIEEGVLCVTMPEPGMARIIEVFDSPTTINEF